MPTATNDLKNYEWFDEFDERQQKEIELALVYAEHFHHGTDGHNAKMIIAKLVELLERATLETTEK